MREAKPTQEDCVTCGACCWKPNAEWGFVQMTTKEAAEMKRRKLTTIHKATGETTMKEKKYGSGLICANLLGAIGVRVGCSIYADRPQSCRNYKPGTSECMTARARNGITKRESKQ